MVDGGEGGAVHVALVDLESPEVWQRCQWRDGREAESEERKESQTHSTKVPASKTKYLSLNIPLNPFLT